MKIISYLLNKLNGFRIGIDEDGNAQLISYRNHPFTNTGGGGGAKRVEAFIEPGDATNTMNIAKSKYDELNVGDVLVATMLDAQGGEIVEGIITFYSPDESKKLVVIGASSQNLIPSISYPVECLLSVDGEAVGDWSFEEINDKYYATISTLVGDDPFTAVYDILFGLDATLVKLERCNSSFEPTEVVSGATLAVKTIELDGQSITCPCLSFSDNVNKGEVTDYYYKATLSDGEINFDISYSGMA